LEIDENIDDPLYEKAISIVGTLNSNGVEASISRKSDRVVKVEIASRGFLCIYYKSKNRAFTITYNELKDKELAKKIELLLKTNKTESNHKIESLQTELEEYATKICEKLGEAHIDYRYLGIYNGMFARISIQSSERVQFIDIYNTKRFRLDVRYTIDDTALREQIISALKVSNSVKPENESDSKRFRELDFLYKTLYPFKDCNFDFSCLKNALERTSPTLFSKIEAISEYSFYELEKAYFLLREGRKNAIE